MYTEDDVEASTYEVVSQPMYMCMYIYMYVCVYVYGCVCVYVCIFVYVSGARVCV